MNHQAFHRRRENAVTSAAHSIHPIFNRRAQGSYVWDVDDNRYLDWTAGIAVMNIGHTHPKVTAAAKAQIDDLVHLCFAVSMNETYIALAEKLVRVAPGQQPKKVFLANSGAEAVENAVKIARAATSRQGVIAFTHAFHGRTHMALSLTSKAHPYKAGFAPRAAEIYRAHYPYVYRNPWGIQAERECAERTLALLVDQVESTIGPGEVAAFIIEPVAGEGGFIPAPPSFLQGLSRYAASIGALVIADEIQSGIGRTGSWWAVDHAGIEPDLLLSAKALASGFPLSAVIGKAEVMDALGPGRLGTTFGGNPVSCAAALATLQVIEEEGLLARATAIGRNLMERLRELQRRYPQIGDVRGLGAMIGIEFIADESKTPDQDAAEAVVASARQAGLLLLPTGTYGNVIRLLPPIRLSDEELREGLQKLEKAFDSALKSAASAI